MNKHNYSGHHITLTVIARRQWRKLRNFAIFPHCHCEEDSKSLTWQSFQPLFIALFIFFLFDRKKKENPQCGELRDSILATCPY